MIMACAARSKTSTLVTLDLEDLLPLGAGLDISVQKPKDFASEQLPLPGMIDVAEPEPDEPLPVMEAVEAIEAIEAAELPPVPAPEPPAPPTRQLQLPW